LLSDESIPLDQSIPQAQSLQRGKLVLQAQSFPQDTSLQNNLVADTIRVTPPSRNWSLLTGNNEYPNAFSMHIKSDLNWEAYVKDAKDGNKPDTTLGRMVEYNEASSTYVVPGKVLSQPLNLRSGERPYIPLSGSNTLIEFGEKLPPAGKPFPISLFQQVGGTDTSVRNNIYRIVIRFEAINP